jgi:hypothetical protein
MSCPGIAAKSCCIAYRWNDMKGAISASFASMPSGSQGIGWQASGNTPCKTQRNHRVGDGCVASNPQVWGTFAGMSWTKSTSKRGDEEDKCEFSVRASLLTLQDGTEFHLDGLSDEDLAELWGLASNGTEHTGVPEKFESSRK